MAPLLIRGVHAATRGQDTFCFALWHARRALEFAGREFTLQT